MASSSSRPYQQQGVFFPIQTSDPDAEPSLETVEWPKLPNPAVPSPRKKRRTLAEAVNVHIAEKGFLLVKIIAEPRVLLVQSEAARKFYILKISQPGEDVEEGEPMYEEPLDLRVSTWRDAPGCLDEEPFFNKLVFWQKLTREDDDPIFALYFEYCNGGTVDNLRDRYFNRENTPVPEHFIWHVAEQLSRAIAFLRYGIGSDDPIDVDLDLPKYADWPFRHHRDLNARNVFINYLPVGRGRVPAAGLETNAFPQVVLGDFGMAGIEGDDVAALPGNLVEWGEVEPELRGWEDIYTLGRILRSLCMTHIPFADGNDHWSSRPDNMTLADANADPSAPPYSEELIELLQAFEWQDMTDGVIGEVEDPGRDIVANERWVVETLLPAAQARVASYRQPEGGREQGHFDELSVAWTKPSTPGVFAYNPTYANEAGDQATGAQPRPPPEEMGPVERNDWWAHQQLSRFAARWESVMPYEVRQVEFEAPVVAEAEVRDAP